MSERPLSLVHEGDTYDVVVVAADDVRAALVAGADTDDADGGAAKSQQDLEVGQDESEQAKDGVSSSRAGL